MPRDLLSQRDKFTNGTLCYSKAGLVALFLWMLGGDFCFVLLGLLLPSLLPLQMKALGASNLEIGLLIGSIPSVIVILINPLFVFNYFILGWAEHHLKEVYIGIAVLYGLVFTAMCLNVNEGEYEAPPSEKKTGALVGIQTYLQECFTHPFYLLFYAATGVLTLPAAVTPFWIFFAKQIGMSLGEYGKVIGWTSLASAALLYPFGVLVDRIHPVKAMLIAGILMVPFGLIFFFFVHSAGTYFIASLAFVPLSTLGLAANLPLFMSVLPAERYGQFCSAQGLVVSFLLIIGNILAGKFMDLVHNDYKFLYLWIFVFHSIGLSLLLVFYSQWKKRGGDASYQPPR